MTALTLEELKKLNNPEIFRRYETARSILVGMVSSSEDAALALARYDETLIDAAIFAADKLLEKSNR
jgi:hypothetical protein